MRRWEKLEEKATGAYKKVEELTDSGNEDKAMKMMPKVDRAETRLNAFKRRKKINPYLNTLHFKRNPVDSQGHYIKE